MVNIMAMVVNQLNKHQTSINQQKTAWISMMKLVKTTFKQILIHNKTSIVKKSYIPYLHWLYKHNWPHKQTHILSFTHTLNICLYNLLRVTNPVGFDRRWDSSPLFFSFSASCGLAAQFGMKTSRGSGQPWEVCVYMCVSVICVCNKPSISDWPKRFALWSSGRFKTLHLCKKRKVLPRVTSLTKDNLHKVDGLQNKPS